MEDDIRRLETELSELTREVERLQKDYAELEDKLDKIVRANGLSEW